MSDYDVIVIGAGHNGLACACYLARGGLRVLVLERSGHIGGAVHTAETIPGCPGYRFDTCSVVHNLVNMTTIRDELQLDALGLRYVETDPFVSVFFPDGACARFYRSVERTCQELERFSPADAEAYRRFIAFADPVVELSLSPFRMSEDGHGLVGEAGRLAREAARLLWQMPRPLQLAGTLLQPYGPLLRQRFASEYARVGVAALAAHGTIGPITPGVAFFACFQAAYHRYGNWHAVGGSGALADAMRSRLEAWGGTVRTSAPVARIVLNGRRVAGVALAGGERFSAPRVVAAINPQTTLLELLGAEHLPSGLARRLGARHRSNAVQFVVHAGLSGLPPWPEAPSDAWNGLQSVAQSLDQVQANFVEAEAGYAPREPAPYLYTSSVIDPELAPAGRHTAYIACASYPSRFADGASWEQRGEAEAHRLLQAIEARAPGFGDRIQGLAWRHALDWERDTGLLGGHPMHLDITPDQVGPLRPLPELAGHRGPVAGLYLSGAGTAPSGGVSGVPGRAAAKAVLQDRRRTRAVPR